MIKCFLEKKKKQKKNLSLLFPYKLILVSISFPFFFFFFGSHFLFLETLAKNMNKKIDEIILFFCYMRKYRIKYIE